MSRTVANLEVSTDTFQNWVNKTNDLLYALTTEIVTANISGANTGTVLDNRIAQLIGKFGANTLVATAELRGGNVSSGGLLTINSNTVFGGNSTVNSSYVNAQANVFVNNAVTQINSYITTITGNTDIKSNSALTAMAVRGNNSTTNTIFNGNDVFIFTNNTSVNSISIFTGNTYVKSNATVVLITSQGNGTTSNVIFQGNLTQFTSNVDVTGTYHTIAGNVYFDTRTLMVDATNDRVGIGNDTPDAKFAVTGTANVSGATRLANTLITIGNANFANIMVVVGNTALQNSLIVTGNSYFANMMVTVGNTALQNSLVVTGNTRLANTLVVTGNTTLANTLAVTGSTTLNNTLQVLANAVFDTDTLYVDAVNNRVGIKNTAPQSELRVTGNADISDTLSTGTVIAGSIVFNADYVIQVVANSNIGTSTSTPLLVYSFPKATYSGAKITAAIKTPTGNTQFSEMVLAHNTVDSYVTVYATVASPPAANAGFFSTAINNANVELSFQQSSATSSVKIVAHLIK